MERLVDYRYSEMILAGFKILPPGIADRLRYTHFFAGTSPIFAGLYDYKKTDDGRSYHEVWSVAYPHSLERLQKRYRQTTIIMPNTHDDYPMALLPMIIVHELGHVLDEILGYCHIAEPVTKYAESSRSESFAEAFTSWLNPGYGEYYCQLRCVDERTLSLFRELEELWK